MGEVMQVGWESDDEEDSEHLDLAEDEIRVEWLGSGNEKIAVSEIFVSDKTFVRGNLVVMESSYKQSGIITKVETFVDLRVSQVKLKM